jgi:hypothetical protein
MSNPDELLGVDELMIDLIVGNRHVSTSLHKIEDIIRERMPEGLTEARQTAMVRYALETHKENRRTYNYVMKGSDK